MAAVIRAPSVCVCLWCQPKDLVVPLVAGATIPHRWPLVILHTALIILVLFSFLFPLFLFSFDDASAAICYENWGSGVPEM